MGYYSLTPEGLMLQCHIQPRASRDAIAGLHGDRLKIQITAPPTDGKANDHLRRFIGRTAGIPQSRVSLIRGNTGRQKTLLLAGITTLPAAFPVARKPERSSPDHDETP